MGKFLWQDGSTYEGEFRDNMISGEGVYKWANGKVYEGEYEVATDEEEVVKMLIDDDNQDMLLTLEAKLKSKKLAEV